MISKWYEAVALPNQEAKALARAFVEHWIVRFGITVNVHKDQRLKTMSQLLLSFCCELGIQKTSTISNQPQENRRIDKTNRTIEECFTKYIGQRQH